MSDAINFFYKFSLVFQIDKRHTDIRFWYISSSIGNQRTMHLRINLLSGVCKSFEVSQVTTLNDFDYFQNVDDLVELFIYLFILFYYLAEIFMITYLGNEMMLSSSRLSNCLFESNWADQPQLIKKCIIIFGEYLKQPQ